MDRLMRILSELRPDVNFEEEDSLIDGNVLDSFDVITLIGEIANEFSVDISVEDIVPEKFNSAESIWELIQTYLN